MRSNIIASHFKSLHSDVDIHFVLSEQAPYKHDCQFPVHLTPSSPTNCTDEVNQIIDKLKPDIVIFDAAGRGQQMKHAMNTGAKVVFISQHPKKRAKGLMLSRLPFITQHWIAQPEFALPALSIWERVKLALYRKPLPTYLGCLYQQPSLTEEKTTLASFGLVENDYVLLSAGSGGHTLDGQPASVVFSDIAIKVSRELKLKCIVVLGSSFAGTVPANTASVYFVKKLENNSFIALLANCRFALLSGGGSLLQGIAMKKMVVTTSVAKDQPARIRACEKEQLVLSAEPNSRDIYAAVQQILQSETNLALNNALTKCSLTNGIGQTEKLLSGLL
ncbi:hypothetical protein KO525_08150 [Psychrosphaera sp. B3R10]|uniref:hypothetical protein n=1 Tax=unclassified Psychrosphaera TaxID=2641570 RepID=UPI001C09900E|nr:MULTISPECIES: hypothetical protein [unclassified Psychrosphaera]MBU2882638.1 hypothetical protein [Psychrosphaera sp. I2R16]MBU2989343.1 hypothetical protein [Psychrosphaera sp. B3R10]